MILMLHIAIALSSLILAAWLYVRPTKRKFAAQYGLITATAASGTALILAGNVGLVHACVSGLAFVAASTAMLVISKQRYLKAAR